MTDQFDNNSTIVKKITKTRKQMEDEIVKTAGESNSDNYTRPYCYSHQPKEHAEVHKKTCEEMRNK
jgi:hypothetical protein